MALITLNAVCMADSAEMLRKQADILREEGKTLDALYFYNQALVSFQQRHDYNGILGVLSGRLISWQHLFNHEEDKGYAILARKEAGSVAFTNNFNIQKFRPICLSLFCFMCQGAKN